MLKVSSLAMAALMSIGITFSVAAEDCFSSRRVRSFEAKNSRELIVKLRRNESYLVKVGVCPELTWAQTIAFDSFGGFDRVCRGDDVLILDNFYPNRVIDRCWIRSIERVVE